MTDAPVKAPWHLWVVGIAALLFNAIGAFDYLMSKTQGEAYMAAGGMTPEQIAHYTGLPLWMDVVWAIGVWAAVLASILLLVRRKIALPVFVVSLAAFLVSTLYHYVLTEAGRMGAQGWIINGVIAGELILLAWYARAMGRRGVLR